jgi:ParB family chromosome partitioning protein
MTTTAPEETTTPAKDPKGWIRFDNGTVRVPVSDIAVGKRYRKDMGDLKALAESIRTIGLIQPPVVQRNAAAVGGATAKPLRLICGARRLAALKMLTPEFDDADTVIVRIASEGISALTLLQAERDENTCRKDFTPSEAVAIGKQLEKLEREEARQRQDASKAKKGGKVGSAQGGGKLPPRSDNGKTRDKVAEVVGMSGKTYEKAKKVVEAAEHEPEKFGSVVEEMDRTGKVDPAYQTVKSNGRSQPATQKEKPTPVDRAARAEEKRRREEEAKPELHPYLVDLTGHLEASAEKLKSVPKGAWELFYEENPQTGQRLVAACEAVCSAIDFPRTPAEGAGPEEPPDKKVQGVGVVRANEAINFLMRIPKNDALRKRGFQIVTDWIRHNS